MTLGNFVLLRMLGRAPKRRRKAMVRIEGELLDTITLSGLNLSDTVNLALYDKLTNSPQLQRSLESTMRLSADEAKSAVKVEA